MAQPGGAALRKFVLVLLTCLALLSLSRRGVSTRQSDGEHVVHLRQAQAPGPPPQQLSPPPPRLSPPIPASSQVTSPTTTSPTATEQWPVELGEQGQLTLDDAVTRSVAVLGSRAAAQVGPLALSGREITSWELAARLAALVTPEALAAERRQREALMPLPPPLPSRVTIDSFRAPLRRASPAAMRTNVSACVSARPPCTQSDGETCLQAVIASVPVWDFRAEAFTTPSWQQAPPADSEEPEITWDRAGTVWSCASADCRAQGSAIESQQPTPSSVLLRRIWEVWEAQQHEDEREAAVSARAVTRLLAEGQHAQRREALEYEHVLLASTTRLHANRSCWRNCRAEGACEWCGTNLCCMKSPKATGVCHGNGGPRSYKCTEVRDDASGSSTAVSAGTAGGTPGQAARRVEALSRRQAEAAEEARASAQAIEHQRQHSRAGAQPAVTLREGWWRSAGRLQPYEGGDLEAEGELDTAVGARSWQGELILSFAHEEETGWLANLLLGLRAVGVEHWLAVTRLPQHCMALFATPQRLSCGFTSWQHASCASPGRHAWRRQAQLHYVLRLLGDSSGGVGGLHVLLIEPDVVVRASPYPPLLAGAALSERRKLLLPVHHLPSSGRPPTCDDANLGTMYVGGARWGGTGDALQALLADALHREAAWCSASGEGDGGGGEGGGGGGGGNGQSTDDVPLRHALRAACNEKTVSLLPPGLLEAWRPEAATATSGSHAAIPAVSAALVRVMGDAPAERRLDVGQALRWWRYEADEVVHVARARLGLSPSETRVAGALPTALLQAGCGVQKDKCWADSLDVLTHTERRSWLHVDGGGEVRTHDVLHRVRLIALSGDGATPSLVAGPTDEWRTRARLAALGAVLRRVAVRQDSPYQPGQQHQQLPTLHADCGASVHAAFLDYARRGPASHLRVSVSELPRTPTGALATPSLVELLERDASNASATVLFLHLREGERLPPLAEWDEQARKRTRRAFGDDCEAAMASAAMTE